MADRIEKRIELKASIPRVWRALTDFREFGEWFRVRLDGPFAPGKESRGMITWPGYEHVVWRAVVQKMEPERLFSFTWPQAKSFETTDSPADYSAVPTTLVEFRLTEIPNGTLLELTESGFSNIPDEWREEAFHRNDGGWTQQMKNIETYVTQAS